MGAYMLKTCDEAPEKVLCFTARRGWGLLSTKNPTGMCRQHLYVANQPLLVVYEWPVIKCMTCYKMQNLVYEWVDFSQFSQIWAKIGSNLRKFLKLGWFCSKLGRLVYEWVTFSCKIGICMGLLSNSAAKPNLSRPTPRLHRPFPLLSFSPQLSPCFRGNHKINHIPSYYSIIANYQTDSQNWRMTPLVLCSLWHCFFVFVFFFFLLLTRVILLPHWNSMRFFATVSLSD